MAEGPNRKKSSSEKDYSEDRRHSTEVDIPTEPSRVDDIMKRLAERRMRKRRVEDREKPRYFVPHRDQRRSADRRKRHIEDTDNNGDNGRERYRPEKVPHDGDRRDRKKVESVLDTVPPPKPKGFKKFLKK